MFELIEVRNYDTHHRYGTDWHTDFIIKTDEEHDIDSLFNRLKELVESQIAENNQKYVGTIQKVFL